jgi:SpoIIAA-like
MASVGVSLEGNIIHARYEGEMTMDLVREGERKIEALLDRISSPAVLYDTLEMEPPTVRLALEMKAFDSRIASRVARSATVVKDAMTAFCAKIAFVFTREHRVFYHDLDAARAWLRGDGVLAASA